MSASLTLDICGVVTTIASFAIGVGELKTATQVGLKFVLSASSVFRLSIEPIVIIINQRKSSDDDAWQQFYVQWEAVWTVLDILSVTQSDFLNYKDQLNSLCTAWESYRYVKQLSEDDKKIDGFIEKLKKIIDEKD